MWQGTGQLAGNYNAASWNGMVQEFQQLYTVCRYCNFQVQQGAPHSCLYSPNPFNTNYMQEYRDARNIIVYDSNVIPVPPVPAVKKLKKKPPVIPSLKLDMLPASLRALADEVLTEKFA